MRLGVYTDYVYRQVDGVLYAERAFALFLAALAPYCERLVLIGRVAPDRGATRYALPDELELAALPHYGSLAKPASALWSLARSFQRMWRAMDGIDVLWVLGPYPHAIVLVALGAIRRRTVVLGVRQDWPRYVQMRHPAHRGLHRAADAMEWIWRAFARRWPVVAVGSDLSRHYSHSPAVLDLAVSLIPASAIADAPPVRDYSGELRVLSVGRLDEEKNPLLLAETLALLCSREPRWRLLVAGDGPLQAALDDRLREIGVAERAELLGYVPMGDGLLELYRSSHALLHVSWTEGFPQVLIEAFATGLPIVATAVGGVEAGVGDAGLLIAPGDADAAAAALERIAADADQRKRLIVAGLHRAEALTIENQVARLASFLLSARRARAGRAAS